MGYNFLLKKLQKNTRKKHKLERTDENARRPKKIKSRKKINIRKVDKFRSLFFTESENVSSIKTNSLYTNIMLHYCATLLREPYCTEIAPGITVDLQYPGRDMPLV